MPKQRFVTDAPSEAFDSVTSDGVRTGDDGVSFEWGEMPVVEIDSPPHEAAFDTDEFYKIEGVTVGRPIKQLYVEDGEVKQLKKPAEELERGAWSFDNVPHTCQHPDTGMVKDVRDITGFWRNPRYDRDEDDLLEDLYVPTDDSDAKSFIEQNPSVSMGYYDERTTEYDGYTGNLTDDDVDGFQQNLLGNHIASVERGRCSKEDGCGIDDIGAHGRVFDEAIEEEEACGCGDDDKNHNYGIDEEPMDDDKDTDGGFTVDLSFDTKDVTVDTLAEEFDAVADLRDRRDNLESAMDEMRDEMGLDESECPCDHIGDVVSDADKVEKFRDELEAYREEEREERKDQLEEFGLDREDYEDASLDELDDELERVEKVAETFDTVNLKNDANEGAETDDGTTDSTPSTLSRGYKSGKQA